MQRRMVLKLVLSSIAAATTPSWAVESASQVTLYKDAQCGCCGAYADYLRDNGFTVAIVETPHLPMMYARYGVPSAFQSCHLAMDRYLAVGHIPVEVINRMLAEKPGITGITLLACRQDRRAWAAVRLSLSKYTRSAIDRPSSSLLISQ